MMYARWDLLMRYETSAHEIGNVCPRDRLFGVKTCPRDRLKGANHWKQAGYASGKSLPVKVRKYECQICAPLACGLLLFLLRV